VPSIFKRTYSKPLPPEAEIISIKGQPHARWKRKGKTVTAPLTKDRQRIVLESGKWYIEYRDGTGQLKRVPGFTDKGATLQLAAKLEKQVARDEMGLIDPFETQRKRPLADHLTDYRGYLVNEGNSPRYVKETIGRLEMIFTGCEFKSFRDFSDAKVTAWMTAQRQSAPPASLPAGPDEFTLAEAAAILDMKPATIRKAVARNHLPATGQGKKRRLPRATVEALQATQGRGVSIQTTNYTLTLLKAFCNWLVTSRRMPTNPFEHLNGGEAKTDQRHSRRNLTADELMRLLTITQGSQRIFRGLTGKDRFVLYATACGTGFRASALASLTPAACHLDTDSPVVVLAINADKSREGRRQPIPPDVADLLAAYLAGKPAGSPIWPGTWASNRKAAEMLRHDLDAAGIPYTVEGPDGLEYADFHALRHTYITALARGGVDLRTAQVLAGHSTPVLTARYSHTRLHDLAGAVEKLPAFLPITGGKTEAGEQLRQTGTDAMGPVSEKLAVRLAGATVSQGHRLTSPGVGEGGEGGKGSRRKSRNDKPLGTPGHQGASSDTRVSDGTRTRDVLSHRNIKKPLSIRLKPIQGRTLPPPSVRCKRYHLMSKRASISPPGGAFCGTDR
jgi:excisionase family DNA binding protein